MKDINQELDRIAAECSEPNWDAYGAYPVNLKSVEMAKRFCAALPPETRMPELCPDNDGEISMEWYMVKPGFVLSVSIGPDGRLTFAGLFTPGDDSKSRVHGTAMFDGKIPQVILDLLDRVVKNNKIENPLYRVPRENNWDVPAPKELSDWAEAKNNA